MTQRFHQTTACIWMRGARAAYLGPGLDLAPHRNAVAVIALGLEAPFDLALSEENGAEPGSRTLRSAVIPAGVLHHLRARGPMAFLYLDALVDDNLTSRVQDVRLPDWRQGAPGDLILGLTPPDWDAVEQLQNQPERKNAAEITVFKSVGIGLEDVAVGAWVYEQALEQGLANPLSLFATR